MLSDTEAILRLSCCLMIFIANSAAHRAGRHDAPQFMDRNNIHDQEHLKDHLDGQINTDKKMTDEEVQFHYFKAHDYDNNDMLDGNELLKAITHHQRDKPDHDPVGLYSDLIEDVDDILKSNDNNDNGYIEYAEYIVAVRQNS